MFIVNLTQHKASPEQVAQGVVDLPHEQRTHLVRLLTVESLPSVEDILHRCDDIAELALHNGLGSDEGDDPQPERAMIGGAPGMMGQLEAALRGVGVQHVYAFTKRVSVEEQEMDGTVRKTAIFKHVGWWPTEANFQ